MRKTGVLAILLLNVYGATAQQEPVDYDISFDHASAKVSLPPAVKPLDESVKYFMQYPENLSYYSSSRTIAYLYDISYGLKIDAKRAKKAEDADYVFRISSPGIKIASSAPQYVAVARRATLATPAANVKGYIYKLRYYMPVTVELLNKQGTVEKTFQLNTDSASWDYHAGFLQDVTSTEDWQPTKALNPFPTEQAAIDNFKKNEEAIYKRMEFNTWYYTMDYAKKLIEIAYGTYRLPSNDFYSKTLSKKGKSGLPELAEAVKKQLDLIEGLGDEKKKEASMAGLKQNMLYFDSAIANINQYGPKVQRVILSNAAWGALLTGQTQKSEEYFAKYYQVENDEFQMYGAYKATFALYQDRDIIAQPAVVVQPDDDVTRLFPEKAVYDPSVVNIVRKEGQIEKNDGEIIKGQITIEYAPKPGGIVDMDLGKAATVYYQKNGGETYQFGKVANTKKIVIGERIFEPVTRKVSALLGAVNATSGDFGNTYFMERMYEKNGVVVYKFWGPGEVILIKWKDEKAVDLPSLLSQRKIGKAIFEACPKVTDFIKTASLKNNMEGAKQLADFLGACQ
jgi:hypothetical protein